MKKKSHSASYNTNLILLWKKERKERRKEKIRKRKEKWIERCRKDRRKKWRKEERRKERVIGSVNKLRDEGKKRVKYFHSLCDFIIQLSEPENERIILILISVSQREFTQKQATKKFVGFPGNRDQSPAAKPRPLRTWLGSNSYGFSRATPSCVPTEYWCVTWNRVK